MDVKTAIALRKSVRKYKKGDIPEEDILEILDAARLAPSGKNIQNWHYLVLRDQEKKEDLAKVIWDRNEEIASQMDIRDPEKGARFRKFCKNFTMFYLKAPVLVLIWSCDAVPDGYPELKLIDTPYYELNRLFARSHSLMNIGAAMENMNLRAIELGYGMCWMTGQNYAADEIQKWVEETVGFKRPGWYFTCMAALGIPEENLPQPPKKQLDEIVTWI